MKSVQEVPMDQLRFLQVRDTCLVRLRVLGLTSVLLLVGCTSLVTETDEAPKQRPTTTAAASSQTQTDPGSASWNLQTLQTLNRTQATQSLTLERAWRLARENDPGYRAALSGQAAAQTESRQGWAAILPQVQAGYSRSKVSGLRRLYGNGLMREAQVDYDSTSAYIQLQQPVFSVTRYAEFEGGKARARLGDAEFAVQEYEAAMRLAGAYLDIIAAQGELELGRALTESLEKQAATQEALFRHNQATRVDAQETQARLARARADLIAAEDSLYVAHRWLRAIIGLEAPSTLDVDALDEDRASSIGQPLPYWLERALANGAAVRAAGAKVTVAETEVRRAWGRHLPTADLVMALSDADNENLESLSQRSNAFTVGLQVTIPIYSGGYDTANHARSRYERRQAQHELTQAREHVTAEVIRQYTALQGGAQRIAALTSSVRSGEGSLEAARYGYEYGVNSNLDVLRRQDSLFRARHELLAARITWLEARVALAAVTGAPMAAVFMEMDQALQKTRPTVLATTLELLD